MLRGRKCRAPNQCSSTQLVPPHSRAFFIGEAMNDIDVGHSLVPSRDTQSLQEETPAPATVYGRQESDESYERVKCREGDLRIVNCREDIQWIAQRLTGGRWRNKSFHRTRASLIQRYGPLEIILALPEHHDGFLEAIPHCKFCGRTKSKPTGGLPRHMFCVAMLKSLLITLNKTEAA
jgi:hypothetical protein